jgi:tripartite-type tricarboxylate transporter receptor subunit TctC
MIWSGASLVRGARTPVPVHAQDTYPSRPIKLIVPLHAGTGIDILARTLGQKMARTGRPASYVGQSRAAPAATSVPEAVAKAAPDGYTLLDRLASTIVQNRALFKTIPYDPVSDFAPIAPCGGSPGLVTNPSVAAKSTADLIAYAKSQSRELFYGLRATERRYHLAMEVFKSATGINVVHIPTREPAGAVQGPLGGQIN